MDGYQVGRDMSRLEGRMDSLERKVDDMGAKTQAALVELDESIDEVAGELEDLADKVEAGDADDATVAEALRARSTKLKGLRPSESVPVDAEPATDPTTPGGVTVDNNDGTVTDEQGNPPV